MNTLKINGIKTTNFVKEHSFGILLVNSKKGLLPKTEKVFQDLPKEYRNIYLSCDGVDLPIEISDYNHVGIYMKAALRMEVTWRKLWLGKIPYVNVFKTDTLNSLVYEETQYPDKAIKAANLLTDFSHYEQKLGTKYNNYLFGVPKYNYNLRDISDKAEKECGTIPYGYGNLGDFAHYFFEKVFKPNEEWEAKKKENKTCSQMNALFLRQLFEYWRITELNKEQLDILKRMIRCFQNEDSIAPVYFATLIDFYNFYLIVE